MTYSGDLTGRRLGGAAIPVLFLTVFVDTLGFSVLLPITPDLVKYFVGNTQQSSLPLGLLVSSYFLAQFFAAPFMGQLSDRFGRRPLILLTLLFATIDYAVSAVANSLILLFVARLATGFCGGNVTVAAAYLADHTPPADRARRYSLMSASMALGIIIGPAIGGGLSHWGLRAPFWFSAGLSFLNLAFALALLPESLDPARRRAFSIRNALPFGFLRTAMPKSTQYVLWAMLFLQLARAGLQAIFVFSMQARFSWNTATSGFALMVFGAFAVASQALLSGPLIRRLGEKRGAMVGLAFLTVGYLLFGGATNGWQIFVAMGVWCLGVVTEPIMQGWASRHAADDEQGALQGSLSSMNCLGWIFGPVLGSWLMAYCLRDQVDTPWVGGAFLAFAILTLIALGITAFAPSHEDAASEPDLGAPSPS